MITQFFIRLFAWPDFFFLLQQNISQSSSSSSLLTSSQKYLLALKDTKQNVNFPILRLLPPASLLLLMMMVVVEAEERSRYSDVKSDTSYPLLSGLTAHLCCYFQP